MILYRITSRAYARDLSGTGSMLFGGRWNPKGVRLLYTSGSLSLAALETIANLSANNLNKSLFCVEISFPDELEITVATNLPEKWNAYPHIADTATLGAQFVKGNGLCLKVPSAIIPTEYNYLLNPLHDDFMKVTVTDVRPFMLDQRLISGTEQ